jgi:hypothetical protein
MVLREINRLKRIFCLWPWNDRIVSCTCLTSSCLNFSWRIKRRDEKHVGFGQQVDHVKNFEKQNCVLQSGFDHVSWVCFRFSCQHPLSSIMQVSCYDAWRHHHNFCRCHGVFRDPPPPETKLERTMLPSLFVWSWKSIQSSLQERPWCLLGCWRPMHLIEQFSCKFVELRTV